MEPPRAPPQPQSPKMPGILRTLFNHVVPIFWIYLRFMVLTVIIFFLVQWYMWKFEEETSGSSSTAATTTTMTSASTPSQQHSSAKQDL